MNRTGPRLSLGIPVYNGAAYLAQLFDCLRAQTFTEYEAIISDNASIDATEQICRRVTASDSRFRYSRNDDNIGAAPNFNRVFEQATGRYFKWTAHDDLLAPTYLERCVAVPGRRSERLRLPRHDSGRQRGASAAQLRRRARPLRRCRRHPGAPARAGRVSRASPDPARRFDDVLHGMRLCSEIFGVMRTELLRRTSLHGSYYGSDKVLLAELAHTRADRDRAGAFVHQALPQGHVLLPNDPRDAPPGSIPRPRSECRRSRCSRATSRRCRWCR